MKSVVLDLLFQKERFVFQSPLAIDKSSLVKVLISVDKKQLLQKQYITVIYNSWDVVTQ